MSREIKVSKYEGNTHYTVVVIDSYGQEHHIGYYKHIYTNKLEEKALEIWSNEVKREITPMERAISWCVNNDISKGREPSLD
jgi:predicted metallo-beta-lactamase superfamily hydrolase